MTTEPPTGWLVVIARMALAVVGWFVALAAVTLAFEPGGSVTVIGPEHRVVPALSRTDVRLVTAGTGFMTIRDGRPGFVADLYRGGAWLVLPPLGEGCSSKAPRAPGIVR